MTNEFISLENKEHVDTQVPIPRRNLPVLVVSSFLLGGAFMLFSSLLQPLVLRLEGSMAIVGTMVSISNFSMLLPMLIFGEYSDRAGRRRPMLIASLFLIIAGLLFVTATHWTILILPVLIAGFAIALNQPAMNAATTESVPRGQHARAFAYRSASRLIAGVFAAILGYVILRQGSIKSTFILFTILVGINLGLIYFMLKETLFFPSTSSSFFQNIKRNLPIHTKLKSLYLYVVITDSFAYGLGWNIIYGLLADFQGVSSQKILLYALLTSLAGGICQLGVVSRVVDHTRKWAIVLSDSIAIPSILICALFPGELTFLVIFILFGIAMSFWGPAVQSLVVDHITHDRIAAEFGKIWGLRGIVGLFPPILGGILAESYGYRAPLLGNVVLGVVSISVAILFLER
ncbi:MAG: MFS transporter [Candidatus Heimdallarchaeota archaeon]